MPWKGVLLETLRISRGNGLNVVLSSDEEDV
jgi:hypothetical protein